LKKQKVEIIGLSLEPLTELTSRRLTMPKAVHDCVDKVKGEKGEESAWAICNAQISEVATALGIVGVGVQEEVPIDDADALPDPEDYASHPTKEEVPIDVAKALPDPDDYASHPVKEHHNPLDIPFGYELNEINMNVKDVNEGGMGSGRHPEVGDGDIHKGSGGGVGGGGGGGSSAGTAGMGGGQPGPLISFGETIIKEMLDSKLSCPCNKKN